MIVHLSQAYIGVNALEEKRLHFLQDLPSGQVISTRSKALDLVVMYSSNNLSNQDDRVIVHKRTIVEPIPEVQQEMIYVVSFVCSSRRRMRSC